MADEAKASQTDMGALAAARVVPPANPPAAPQVAQPAGGTLVWVEHYQGIAAVVAFVLVLLYVAPVLMIGIAALTTDSFQEPSFAFSWFAAFMKSADSTLNEYHKVLFPVISAISIIVFRGKPDWRFLLLAGFIFLAFAFTTFVGVLFDMQTVQTALSSLESIDAKLVKTFFGRVQESLLMYLMMLFGIGVTNAGKAKTP